jgi:nucleoside-diphosphate-sugar epimerase
VSDIEEPSQYIIYGANGWLGRSALKSIIDNCSNPDSSKILLIGSRASAVEIEGRVFQILEQGQAFQHIRENSSFYNAAFLRKEKLAALGFGGYVNGNNSISNYAESVISSKRLSSFINISSGAARAFDLVKKSIDVEPYGYLKHFWEKRFVNACQEKQTQSINCRVYSVSGRYINEFKNLALTSFISQAKEKKRIEVKSPKTLRTLIDAVDLAHVLHKLTNEKCDFNIDSGGQLVSLSELAESVAKALDLTSENIEEGTERSLDYFGDYEKFNSLANRLDVEIKNLDSQVEETLRAYSLQF